MKTVRIGNTIKRVTNEEAEKIVNGSGIYYVPKKEWKKERDKDKVTK
jgi:hypothetical protein